MLTPRKRFKHNAIPPLCSNTTAQQRVSTSAGGERTMAPSLGISSDSAGYFDFLLAGWERKESMRAKRAVTTPVLHTSCNNHDHHNDNPHFQ